jgi:hypothetical protein
MEGIEKLDLLKNSRVAQMKHQMDQLKIADPVKY